MLDEKEIKFFSFSWDEGKFFDFWMFVHLISGFLIGMSLHLLGFGPALSYFGTLAALSLYEVIEEMFDIDETIENRVTDIVFGMIGLVLSYEFIAPNVDFQANVILLTVAVVLVSITSFLGWSSYKKRSVDN